MLERRGNINATVSRDKCHELPFQRPLEQRWAHSLKRREVPTGQEGEKVSHAVETPYLCADTETVRGRPYIREASLVSTHRVVTNRPPNARCSNHPIRLVASCLNEVPGSDGLGIAAQRRDIQLFLNQQKNLRSSLSSLRWSQVLPTQDQCWSKHWTCAGSTNRHYWFRRLIASQETLRSWHGSSKIQR